MTTMQNTQIDTAEYEGLSNRTSETGIDSAETLVVGRAARRVTRWDDAIATMMSWAEDPNVPINLRCLRVAIAYAAGLRRRGGVGTPSSIVVNEDGTISFEWRQGASVITYEFTSQGELEVTQFRNGRVVSSGVMQLNRQHRITSYFF